MKTKNNKIKLLKNKKEKKELTIFSKPKRLYRPIINCYTDGSYSYMHNVGGFCAFLECEGKSLILSGSEHQTTNNRMELRAVLEALRIVKVPCEFYIHSDSMYVVNPIEKKWLQYWVKNKWITRSGTPVSNSDIWKQILPLLDYHTVHLIYVKGHAGIEGNELCNEVSSMHMQTLKAYT